MGAALDRLLGALDDPRKSGSGWRAKCSSCGSKDRRLSIAEAEDGRLWLHCFGGCSAEAALAAVGLSMSALFPPGLRAAHTPAERRAAWRAAREAAWAAALGVLGREAAVIEIAAGELAAGRALGDEDLARLRVACDRVQGARAVLT